MMQTAGRTAEELTPGTEWIVDAHGCDPAALRSAATIATLFERVTADLRLTAVAEARWHVFPGSGGLTGMLLLAESHLTCHTFPELAFAGIDLYCCRAREGWDWAGQLPALLGARGVNVRELRRGEAARRLLAATLRDDTEEGRPAPNTVKADPEPPLRILRARLADITPDVEQLVVDSLHPANETFAETHRNVASPRDRLREMRALLEAGELKVWMARIDNTLAGLVCWADRGGRCSIADIMVDPRFDRGQVTRALLTHAE